MLRLTAATDQTKQKIMVERRELGEKSQEGKFGEGGQHLVLLDNGYF